MEKPLESLTRRFIRKIISIIWIEDQNYYSSHYWYYLLEGNMQKD